MLMASLLRDEHLHPDGSKPTWFGSVGREVISVEIKVADETGTPVRVREIGESMPLGEHTMAGDWRNPELTTARYQDSWIRTKVPKRAVTLSEAMQKSGVGNLLRRQARERFLAAVAPSSTSEQK